MSNIYRAKVKCFVNNTLRNAGDVFEYDGKPNDCLEPLEFKIDKEPQRERRTLSGTTIGRGPRTNKSA